jgi:hypothetical protein
MEGREFVVNQFSPKITQGIAPTLILIRVALGVSNMQSGPILSGPPSSALHSMSLTEVRVNTILFTGPGRLQVPAEMSVSKIKPKPSSGDLGSALSSVDDVASVAV